MDKALAFLSDQLNEFFKTNFGIDEDMVRIGRLIHQDGSLPVENTDRLVLSFVSFNQEKTLGSNDTRMGFAARGISNANAPLNYNLSVVLASSFTRELEGLKIMSAAVEYLHEHSVFTASSSPTMPKGVDKISTELCTLSLKEIDALWSGIGAKAQPCVLYKVRVLAN